MASGVSAGALNSVGLSLFAPTEGAAMADWFENLWLGLTTKQIYVDWPLGILDGLLNKSGVFDNTPLLNLVTKLMQEKVSFKREIIVSAVDVNTGKLITFDSKTTPFADYPTVVVASASIPFIFPHRDYKNYMLIDGSTAWNTNLVDAVDACVNKGFAEKNVVLDIILCGEN